MIKCKCGCGFSLEETDKYGRKRSYISGHNGRKYDDPKQYKREWNHCNRGARYKYKVAHLRAVRIALIVLLGAKCERCRLRYNRKNAAVFDFHHRDPSKRKHRLCLATLNHISFKEAVKEAEKCFLLCANCHRLNHSEEY